MGGRVCSALLTLVLACCMLAGCSQAAAGECTFPDVLRDPSGGPEWWLYHVTYAGAQLKNNTIVYVEFYASQMSTTSLGGNDVTTAEYPYERECLEQYEDNTYLLAHHQRGAEVSHVCVQFIVRSRHVVQLATSELRNVSSPLNCSQEILSLDPWPLIRYDDHGAESSACPVPGGYDIALFNHMSSDLCTDKYYIARYECACTDSSIIHLDLRACHIGPALVGMETQQEVISLATWEQDEHQFSVLKRPHMGLYWSLRVPRKMTSYMTGYLSSDVICAGDSKVKGLDNVVELHLSKRIVDSTCADVSPHCSLEQCTGHSLFSELYCEATCGHCDRAEKNKCRFPPSAQGSWTSVLQTQSNFTISDSEVIIGDDDPLPCISYDPASKTYQLLKFDQTGCSPQYVCLTIRPIGPSVISYKMSPGPAWDPLFKPGVCYSGRGYRTFSERSRFSLAVASKHDGMVSCQVPGLAYTVLTTLPDGDACHGTLYKPDCAGGDGSILSINYTQCLDAEPSSRQFACVAQLPVFSPRRMILIRDTRTGDLFCLSFAKVFSYLELLPASKCSGTFNQKDILANIRLTQEITNCITDEFGNYDSSLYINYTRSIGDIASNSAIADRSIKTVKPVMSPDRDAKAKTLNYDRNYYHNSVQDYERKSYSKNIQQVDNGISSDSIDDQDDDCEGENNSGARKCRSRSNPHPDINRTVKKSALAQTDAQEIRYSGGEGMGGKSNSNGSDGNSKAVSASGAQIDKPEVHCIFLLTIIWIFSGKIL